MLTKEQRDEIRALIKSEIARLTESIAALEERTVPVSPDSAIGRISRMDSMVNRQTAEMALDQERRMLERLKGKLPRVDDPDFGQCMGCSEWIPMERLRAAPDRGLCTACLGGAGR